MTQLIDVPGEPDPVEFPDGMSDDAIAAAIRQHHSSTSGLPSSFASQSVSPLVPMTGLGRGLALGGSALARGGAMALGLPGDLERLGTNLGAYLGLANPNEPTIFPTSETTLGLARNLGLIDQASLIPGQLGGPLANTERLGFAGVEGLAAGATPTAIGRGVASIAPSLLRPGSMFTGSIPGSAIAGGVGGLASEEASQLGLGPASQIAAGVLGGTVLGGLVNRGAIERVAGSLGSSKTLYQGGAAVQDELRAWKSTTMPAKLDAAWAPVDAKVPATADVDLSNFLSWSRDLTRNAGQLQPVARLLSSDLPPQIYAKLNTITRGGTIPTTWADAREIRTILGDALARPQLVNDLGEANLRAGYKAITEDLLPTASANGASEEFSAANAETSRLHQLAEGPFAKIISGVNPDLRADPKPEDVASRLLSAGKRGATDLTALRSEAPAAVDELAATLLRTEPKRWSTLSPEAQEALVPDPQARRRIELSLSEEKMSLGSATAHGIGSIVGGNLGHELGILLGNSLGFEANPLVHGAIGDVLGIAAPWLYRGARNIARNPARLSYPVAGGIGAAPATISPQPSLVGGP